MNKFEKEVLNPIVGYLKNSKDVAFVIDNRSYTYRDLSQSVSKIRIILQESVISNSNIGLVCNNDLDTYASILALWLEGFCYVPLNPHWPTERCENIIDQVGLSIVLDSKQQSDRWSVKTIQTSMLSYTRDELDFSAYSGDKLAYVLFTSGSTGEPKGVPITRTNLGSFIESMRNLGLNISSSDKCLQPFDLSFDFSVSAYLIPLVCGASTYTVPGNVVKYIYIATLILEQKLTVLQMVPSMIRNLLPYIEELDLSKIRYNILCGEALVKNDIMKWHKGNPHMISYNMYGPTENTVFCTYYIISESNLNSLLECNDVVSIGKSFLNSSCILINDAGDIVDSSNQEGELCLSGRQLTPGYWKNEKQNNEKFFLIDGKKYYKSGDLCFYSNSKDLMYIGRIDSQVKINGFRVELGEIESLFKNQTNNQFCIVLPYKNDEGATELALISEGDIKNANQVKAYLEKKLPKYMIPKRYLSMDAIPLNQNGKIDRNAIYIFFNLIK